MADAKALSLAQKNKRLAVRLCVGVVGMFIFAVGILPPMYEVFCEITGLNGKVPLQAADPAGIRNADQVQSEHRVKVSFLSITDKSMPWAFKPNTPSITLAPGERFETSYFAENLSSQYMVGHAVPSVSPTESTSYFKKIECFCFNQQPLEAGETADMSLVFYLADDIPDHIKEITLAYTLYPAEQNQTAALD